MAGYAHPEVLVDTTWVALHRDKPDVRLVEVDVDSSAYAQGAHPWSHRLELDDATL